MKTELYHCTDLNGLYGIISSQAFQPSYCLEKAEYLKNVMDFAFAMVSFADLLPMEVEDHMAKFRSVAYFKMAKQWQSRMEYRQLFTIMRVRLYLHVFVS